MSNSATLPGDREIALARGPKNSIDPSLPWTSIRSAERNIEPTYDWRLLGTETDPAVQELAAEAR